MVRYCSQYALMARCISSVSPIDWPFFGLYITTEKDFDQSPLGANRKDETPSLEAASLSIKNSCPKYILGLVPAL